MTERRIPITVDGMPPGWTVEYVEYPGCDSPDREYQAKHPVYGTVRNCASERRDRSDDDLERLCEFARRRHPQIKTIFLDVDEVLVDWVGATLALLGYDPTEVHARWNALAPRPWDLFSVLGCTPSQVWREIDKAGPGFWANLRTFDHVHELYNLCEAFAPTALLTSPSHDPSSHAGKAQWIQRTFGRGFRDYLIGAVKHRCAHPGALLIDDSPKNCQAFRDHGGHAILFPGCGNDLHAMPEADRVPYVQEQLKEYRR